MRAIGYLLVMIVNLLIIIMNIFKLFLFVFRFLGYFFLIMLVIFYATNTASKKMLISHLTSTIFCFAIFYGYYFILDFLIGFKEGLLKSLENNK
ncbi:hypothetical protein [Fusobacterium sp.]|uniref:hypothetical protein n=2 Tax=Fusobacterium sp. TaxID=68766 RepID=UPI00261F2EDB|nr:hypothetical protein [Fusobacterium sp.]